MHFILFWVPVCAIFKHSTFSSIIEMTLLFVIHVELVNCACNNKPEFFFSRLPNVRGLDGCDHFRSQLISLGRRPIYKDTGIELL